MTAMQCCLALGKNEKKFTFAHFVLSFTKPSRLRAKTTNYQMVLIFFKTQSFFFGYNFIKYTWMIHIKKGM